jgi:hypothetical protein
MGTALAANSVTLDRTVAYKVDGYGGVAWRVLGPATTTVYEGDALVCNDDECDHMLGDDREFTFDVEDLTALDRDEFCGECGQIGCGHDGGSS